MYLLCFLFLVFFFNDTGTTEIYTSFPTRRSSDLVAGADALQVEPGDQLLQAPGPPQVGGQDGGGELLPLARSPPVVDPRLLDLDVAQAGLDRPLGEVAVADDLAATGIVHEVVVGGDIGGALG